MQDIHLGRYLRSMLVSACILLGSASSAMAINAQSPNFELSEPEFGAGASLESCSGEFCARATIGDTAAGASESTESTAEFGDVAGSTEPLVEVIVDVGESNLGLLDISSTATRTTTIQIRTHLSDGYALVIAGQPPKYGDHELHTPTTPTDSKPGVEQFAINLVKNETPSIGDDPEHETEDGPVDRHISQDYKTPNQFMYRSGDVVAETRVESSQVKYTVSMIVNVANTTPAGHFAGDFSAIVVPLF